MRKLVDEMKDPDIRLILVLGGNDTGKTTLIQELAGDLARKAKVGVVDADVGQSHLGPPSTVAWGRIAGKFKDWAAVKVEDFYYTGAVSPAGNLLQLLTGTKLMTQAALAVCDKVLVDTTGLVEQPIGRVIKRQKIDLLRPDQIVAIERKQELIPIIKPLRVIKRLRVKIIHPHGAVREKTVIERNYYRHERFRHYFYDAGSLALFQPGTGITFTGGDYEPIDDSHVGRVVSLKDSGNRDLALGIIMDFDSTTNMVYVKTPLRDAAHVASITVGGLKDVLKK